MQILGRSSLFVWAMCCGLLSPAVGQDQPTSRTVTTADGWTLPIDFYYPHKDQVPPTTTQNTPTVILVHGHDGNRLVWRGLADQLLKKQFAVVTVDLRKHGESQAPAGYRGSMSRITPADFQAMANLDLPAVKGFLLEQHENQKLNIRKTAIVAADDMVPVVTTFAIADWMAPPYPDAPTQAARTPRGQDIRALAMLSPTNMAGPLSANNTARILRNDAWMVAAWIAVGEDDRVDKGTAEAIYDRLIAGSPTGKDFVTLVEVKRAKVRGTELLNLTGENLEGQILQFLEDNLKILNDPWQTRISRLH